MMTEEAQDTQFSAASVGVRDCLARRPHCLSVVRPSNAQHQRRAAKRTVRCMLLLDGHTGTVRPYKSQP